MLGLVLRRPGPGKHRDLLLPVTDLKLPKEYDTELHATAAPGQMKHQNEYLLLDYDVLDQQIIDVDGRKVVRVNDINLQWEPGENGTAAGLLVQEVEVGNRGALRRLLKGLPGAAVDAVSNRFKARVIPWEWVDLIERDPARRVRLKIGRERLAKLHPSDIADILEDLAPGRARGGVYQSAGGDSGRDAGGD